jgi:PKD repeat protein
VPTTISIQVQDSSSPPASNALIFIDFNDTQPSASNSVINVSLPYTGSYTFISPGVYTVNFTVYNYVSSITQIITIAVNAPFNGYAFTVCYLLPTLTSSVNDNCNLTSNSGYYYIPKQSQLVMYVTWTNPSKERRENKINSLFFFILRWCSGRI